MENLKKPSPERVTLSEATATKLDQWIEKVTLTRQGVELSRRDVVEWLISNHSENLSPSEEKELADTHYNEVKFLQYAIREIKEAKGRGEETNLAELLQKIKITPRSNSKNQKAKTKPEDVEVSHV